MNRPSLATLERSVEDERRSMRLLAGYKLFVGLLLVMMAAEAFHLFGSDLADVAERWILRLHADPHNPYLGAIIAKLSAIDLRTLEEFVVLTTLFGAVHVVEGIGLWLSKAWAESLCVVSGSLCLPLEAHELAAELHATSIVVFGINVAVVIYLLRRLKYRRRRASNPH